MTVLVTGGLGFIGAKVVLQLLKRDIPVIVADLDIEKNKGKLENATADLDTSGDISLRLQQSPCGPKQSHI